MTAKILPFRKKAKEGGNDEDPKDEALICSCGSVKWCLRRDYRIECSKCGDVLVDVTWGSD